MRKILFVLITLSITFLMFISSAVTEDYKYIGVKRCKMCHKGATRGKVYEKWMSVKHSKAFETLKKEGQEKNPKCLQCHTTGFNKGGYKLDDPKNKKFEGVQCESCHGPGSGYKSNQVMLDRQLSIENGLLIPNEATCRQCHNKNSPTFKGFDYKTFFKKIDHRYMKREKPEKR